MRKILTAGLLVLGVVTASMARAQEDGGAGEDAAPGEDAALDASSALDAGLQVDASAQVDAGLGCGEVTYRGLCDGDVVEFCYDGELMREDCAQSGRSCGLWDCLEPGCYGHGCVAPLGQPCGVVPCDISQGQGCLGGVCAASATCQVDTYANACLSDEMITKCFAYSYDPATGEHATGVVWDHDCTEAGTEPYTCGERADGTDWCLGLESANCDPAQGYECFPGLSCVGSICVVGSGDGGSSPGDAGPEGDGGPMLDAGGAEPGGEDDCACRGRATPPAALLVALLGLSLVARLRRR